MKKILILLLSIYGVLGAQTALDPAIATAINTACCGGSTSSIIYVDSVSSNAVGDSLIVYKNGTRYAYKYPSGGSTYTLPVATTSILGGVRDGSGIAIGADGTISAETQTLSQNGSTLTFVTKDTSNVTTTQTLRIFDFWRSSVAIPVNANGMPDGTNDTIEFIQHRRDIFIGNESGLIRAGNGNGTSNTQYNTVFGKDVLSANTTGFSLTAMGWGVLKSNTTGTQNTGVGAGSLYTCSSGIGNSGFGTESLYNLTTGQSNTASGYKSMILATTASRNSAYGRESLFKLTTGVENNAFGSGSLNELINGSNNSAGGQVSLYWTTSSNNTGWGWHSGAHNSTGTGNTYLGYEAGGNTASNHNTGSTGSNNTLLGSSICINQQIGSNNTFVGSTPTVPTSVTNSSYLGFGSVVSASNQIQLGNSAVTQVRTFGAVVFQQTYTGANVPNNSMYVDSTTGKLFFKDASGVVNPLY